MDHHLRATPLLDFQHPLLRRLLDDRGWASLGVEARTAAVYDFVRDEIAFGYNAADEIPASQVLRDGLGQCNTKTTLLMALLRGVGVPTRFHGATIHKRLQRGVVTGLPYLLAPRDIVHSWAEVFVDGRWVGLEGVILDQRYLDGVRSAFPAERGAFLGFAVGTDDLARPPVEWTGSDTYIQATGVNQDFGVFEDPDTFYAEHGGNLSGVRAWVFERRVRHLMNRRVVALRQQAVSSSSVSQVPAPRAGDQVVRVPPGGAR